MKATHKELEIMVDGILTPIKLQPGQFITGRFALHFDYHQGQSNKRYSRKAAPSPYSLIRWLQTLQSMQMLSIKTYNKYSIITILNWEQYQDNEQQASNRRATDEHKQTQDKHIKEVVSFLNEVSNRNFQPKGQNASFINARFEDGYSVDDLKTVCLFKWNDPKFDKQYFRPTTLFRDSNFEGYLSTARERGATTGHQQRRQEPLEEVLS
jgi:uncharacterized phage protein (TIGR02220 family)